MVREAQVQQEGRNGGREERREGWEGKKKKTALVMYPSNLRFSTAVRSGFSWKILSFPGQP